MNVVAPRPAVTDWALPTQGVTLDGWLRPRATLLPGDAIGPDDLERLLNWRFSHVRVPVALDLADGSGGITRIEQALDLLWRYRLPAILSIWLDPATVRTTVWVDPAVRDRLRTVWAAIATHLGDHPACLSYELLVDPDPPDTLTTDEVIALGGVRLSPAAAKRPPVPGSVAGRAWSAVAGQIVTAIRDTGSHRPVIIGAPRNDPGALTHLRPIADDRVVYGFRADAPIGFTRQGLAVDIDAFPEAHVVPDPPRSYPGMYDGERWDRARLESWFAPARAFREGYRVPLYCTGFGVSAGAPRSAQLTWLRSFLRLCREHHTGWAYDAYHDARFGLVCTRGPYADLERYRNGHRLDYDLLGVLQGEA